MESQLRGDFPCHGLCVWAINLTIRYLLCNCSLNVPTWALGTQSCPGPNWLLGDLGLPAAVQGTNGPGYTFSSRHPNSTFPGTSKEADQGSSRLASLNWNAQVCKSGSSFRCYKNSILSAVFPHQSLSAGLSMLWRDEQVSFVPVLQIRSLWYRDGKLSEQKNFPTPALSCLWMTPLLAIVAV